MKIFDFIRQLAPIFKRDDLSEKLRMLRIYLEDQTIPTYENYIASNIKTKSKAMVEFEKQFTKNVRTQFRGTWAEVTLQVLKNISANISVFETIVDKNYAKDILVDAITFKKAEILRILAIADLVVTYSRQNMLYLLASEANVEAHSLPAGKERPLPELAWLEENLIGYLKSFPIMALKGSELLAAVNSIPDIVISEDSLATSEATIGAVKLDPLASGLIPIAWNPFYALGVRNANRENLRIERAKSEKRAMEFRIEQLRMQANGEADAQLEKTISFYEQQVDLLASKIAKYED